MLDMSPTGQPEESLESILDAFERGEKQLTKRPAPDPGPLPAGATYVTATPSSSGISHTFMPMAWGVRSAPSSVQTVSG